MRHDFLGETLDRLEDFFLSGAEVNIENKAIYTHFRIRCESVDHLRRCADQ